MVFDLFLSFDKLYSSVGQLFKLFECESNLLS